MNRWPSGWWVAPACIGSIAVWAYVGYTMIGGE